MPRWQTIAETLRRQIESGELPARSRVPGENALAEQYQVSRVTVRRAIEWLSTRRLVERRPGQGTFVIKIEPLVTTLSGGSKRTSGLSGGGKGKAVFEEAESRGLLDQVTADPRVNAISPARPGRIKQVGLRDQMVVRPPNDDEVRFFQLPDDGSVPVVVIFRTGYADSPEGPTPFRVTITIYPADRNQFVINSGKVGKVPAEPIDFLESSAYDGLV
jgi:DNA-binding GntR family transcriptional regulator